GADQIEADEADRSGKDDGHDPRLQVTRPPQAPADTGGKERQDEGRNDKADGRADRVGAGRDHGKQKDQQRGGSEKAGKNPQRIGAIELAAMLPLDRLPENPAERLDLAAVRLVD